jgi:hypothetical protein
MCSCGLDELASQSTDLTASWPAEPIKVATLATDPYVELQPRGVA